MSQIIDSKVFSNTKRIFSLLKLYKVDTKPFYVSIVFSLLYTLVAAYGACLLLPLVQGIISADFSHVRTLAGLSIIFQSFPQAFDSSTALFIFLIFWTYLTAIVKNIFHYMAILYIQRQAKLTIVTLRETLIEKCLSFGKSFYDQNTVSYLQSIFMKSVVLIEGQFKVYQDLISQALVALGYLMVMIFISWKLTLIAAVVFPIVPFCLQRIIGKIKDMSLKHHQFAIGLNEKIFNILYCMPVIKGFSKEKEELKEFSKMNREESLQSFKIHRLTSLTIPISDLGMMTAILAVALGLAYIMHVDPSFNATKAFVFLYLATRISNSMNTYNQFRMSSAKILTALEDIDHVLNRHEDTIIAGGTHPFLGLKGSIEFKDLSFRYAKDAPLILDRINFTIEPRSIVAIVGPSGSGKSTLGNLLLRFYDCPAGSILINGQDIRDYEISSLRNRIAFVGQEVLLFNDTVRKNILYGSTKELSDEGLMDLANRVQISGFIERLPLKYDTVVGERATRLSGGERQRLSIARALVKDADIVIMDEATSSLDSETELRINEFMSEIAKDKTLIIIAHRLSTIKNADKVIYMEQGRVVESGSLQELVDRKGGFYKQWEAQKI